MTSANQADSSSEETSSSSDETYVEVIATILRSHPLQTNSRRGVARALHTNGAKSVQQVFWGDWELERPRPGEESQVLLVAPWA